MAETKTSKPAKIRRFHVGAKDRAYLTANLALLLKSAVSVNEALQALQDTSHSTELKKAIQQMHGDIDVGMPLWKALDRSGVVSTQTLALIRLGEQSGNLTENMRVAAEQEEKQRVFKAKVRSALLYPAFVLSMTMIVGLGVAWFLLPKLAQTFSQLNVTLPVISRTMIGFGLLLKEHGLWLIPLSIIIFLAIGYVIFAAPKTRHIGQHILFTIPGVSKLLHEVEVARFGYLLGTLLEAGLSVTQALQLLQEASGAPQYKKLYAYLHEAFNDGYSFRASLPAYKQSGRLLPPAVQQMLIAGERSGALPETLINIGTIYEKKADVSTQNLETVLEPILLILVWIGVMCVAVAVIMPIYSLVGGLDAVQ